ncbi:hypothetical protein L9F63_013221, partial [Diploptera punctata]
VINYTRVSSSIAFSSLMLKTIPIIKVWLLQRKVLRFARFLSIHSYYLTFLKRMCMAMWPMIFPFLLMIVKFINTFLCCPIL